MGGDNMVAIPVCHVSIERLYCGCLLGGFLFGTEIGGSSKKITLYLSLSFCRSGHVPHHSDQMSQRSQVSRVTL